MFGYGSQAGRNTYCQYVTFADHTSEIVKTFKTNENVLEEKILNILVLAKRAFFGYKENLASNCYQW